MGKVTSINKEQDESVQKVLRDALAYNYDGVMVLGYKNKRYIMTHSSGVSTVEELGALEIAKDCILKSAAE